MEKQEICLRLPTADTSSFHGCQCSQPCKTQYILLPRYWDTGCSGPKLIDVLEKLKIKLWSLNEGIVCLVSLEGHRPRSSTVHITDTRYNDPLVKWKTRPGTDLLCRKAYSVRFTWLTCLALLLRSELGKAYVLSGSKASVWISAVIGTSGFTLQWNACLHVVSHSSFIGAALPSWSWILSGKNQHTYCSLNIVIGGKTVSLSSPVLKWSIGSNF